MGVFGMRAGEGEAIVSRCLVHRPSASAVHVDMTEGPSGIGPDVIRNRGERMTNDTAESDLARLARRRIIDHMDCDDCTEDYVFLMHQDDREFGIGLTTVLACLAFAEHERAIPPLPPEWWIGINRRYR